MKNKIGLRTLSRDSAQRYYDRLGGMYDWFSGFEARAKQRALENLALAPGLKMLNVGLGTGRDHRSIQNELSPGGFSIGVDISPKMLQIASTYSKVGLCRADGGDLPFPEGTFDRLYCSYVLDLVPFEEIIIWLNGFRRVLKSGGRLVNLSLTEGVDLSSRLLVSLWKRGISLHPGLLGGCRPLSLEGLVQEAGFKSVERTVVVQLGLPTEMIVAS